MKKKVLIIFGVFILVVLSITIFKLTQSLDRSEYEVDNDYKSVSTTETVATETELESPIVTDSEGENEKDKEVEAGEVFAVISGEEDTEMVQDNLIEGDTEDLNSTNNLDNISSKSDSGENPLNSEENSSGTLDTQGIDNEEEALKDINYNENVDYNEDIGYNGEEIDLGNIATIKEESFQEDDLLLQIDITQDDKYVNYTGEQWIDDKVNENIEEIAEEDIVASLALSEKVDTEKIYDYLDDGLTDDERVELTTYLKSVLTDEEIQQIQILFSRYEHLLDQ